MFVIAFCLLLNVAHAQSISPFNKKGVVDSSNTYSFIVSGHFHGASTNISTYPASTILANIDTLNSLNPSFMMSLGDMFLDVDQLYLEHYQRTLFDKLKMPLFNAVGNHDVSNGNLYEKQFGKTYFYFKKASELYIVLNTEINDGSIKGEQLEMLIKALEIADSSSIKNIFIFSHRPVWSEENPLYETVFKENTKSNYGSVNFENEIRPLLLKVNKPVYWISGSLGNAPASFFFDKEQNSKLIFMQTAIRNVPHDAVLNVKVNGGVVTLNGISLTSEPLKAIESYNLNFWRETAAPEQAFNYRLLPLMIFQMVRHYYFWSGIIFSLVVLFAFTFVKKKWKRKG